MCLIASSLHLVSSLQMTGTACDTPPHASELRQVRGQFVESIRRVNRIVTTLFQARHLSDEERQRINSQPTTFDKASQLLDMICQKPVDAYQCFLKALENTKQEHFLDLLSRKGLLLSCFHIPVIEKLCTLLLFTTHLSPNF